MYRRKKLKWLLFLVPIIILFGVSAIVMWLWNALLPDLLHLPMIGFWQAMGILILCKILFASFGKGGCNKKCGRNPIRKKMEDMTDEEKEAFKQRFKDICFRRNNNKESNH